MHFANRKKNQPPPMDFLEGGCLNANLDLEQTKIIS